MWREIVKIMLFWLLSAVATAALVVVAVDAATFAMLGDCDGCLVLEGFFALREGGQ